MSYILFACCSSDARAGRITLRSFASKLTRATPRRDVFAISIRNLCDPALREVDEVDVGRGGQAGARGGGAEGEGEGGEDRGSTGGQEDHGGDHRQLRPHPQDGDRFAIGAFTGGPHRVWGLTAFMTEGVLADVVLPAIDEEMQEIVGGG